MDAQVKPVPIFLTPQEGLLFIKDKESIQERKDIKETADMVCVGGGVSSIIKLRDQKLRETKLKKKKKCNRYISLTRQASVFSGLDQKRRLKCHSGAHTKWSLNSVGWSGRSQEQGKHPTCCGAVSSATAKPMIKFLNKCVTLH